MWSTSIRSTPETLQALLERAHHGVVAEVEDRHQRRGVEELAGAGGVKTAPGRLTRADQPPDFGGQHEVVARLLRQDVAHPLLGAAVAVQGRRVEEAKPDVVGVLNDGVRGRVGDGVEEAAERCAPKPSRVVVSEVFPNGTRSVGSIGVLPGPARPWRRAGQPR